MAGAVRFVHDTPVAFLPARQVHKAPGRRPRSGRQDPVSGVPTSAARDLKAMQRGGRRFKQLSPAPTLQRVVDQLVERTEMESRLPAGAPPTSAFAKASPRSPPALPASMPRFARKVVIQEWIEAPMAEIICHGTTEQRDLDRYAARRAHRRNHWRLGKTRGRPPWYS